MNQRMRVFVVVTELHQCLVDEIVKSKELASYYYGLDWYSGGEVTYHLDSFRLWREKTVWGRSLIQFVNQLGSWVLKGFLVGLLS